MSSKKHPLTLISWNVNGLRAILKKDDFSAFLGTEQPDLLCLQETKAHPDQIDDMAWAEGYHCYWNSAVKKGYSSTAILTKVKPLSVVNGLDIEEHDQEGRVITAEFPDFYVVTVYTPNSQNELRRLDYRQRWDRDFLLYLQGLEKKKPVLFNGDLNVAHKEIDLARPKANRRNAGFTDEERAGFDALIEAGFVDTFREFNQEPDQYSWWSYRFGARDKNIGWRLDYWCVSEALKKRLKDAAILQSVMGSDHCPVKLVLKSR